MKFATTAIAVASLTAGCVAPSPALRPFGAIYLQATNPLHGIVVTQINMQDATRCAAVDAGLKRGPWAGAAFVRCAAVSASSSLPFRAVVKSAHSGELMEMEGIDAATCESELQSIVANKHFEQVAGCASKDGKPPAWQSGALVTTDTITPPPSAGRYLQLRDRPGGPVVAQIDFAEGARCESVRQFAAGKVARTIACGRTSASATLNFNTVFKSRRTGALMELEAIRPGECPPSELTFLYSASDFEWVQACNRKDPSSILGFDPRAPAAKP